MDSPRSRLLEIAGLSAFILFLEMLLIRWVSTEVRLFAYLQNGVLVAAFLGLGVGALRSRESARLAPAIAGLLFIALFIRDPLRWYLSETLTQGLAAFADSPIWSRTLRSMSLLESASLRLKLGTFAVACALSLLGAVCLCFYPLGQFLGRWMDEYPAPLSAYSANLAGSLAGIALFDGLTLSRTPPRVWLAAAALGWAWLCLRSIRLGPRRWALAALALAAPILCPPASPQTTWSPYQKLSRVPLWGKNEKSGDHEVCGETILVNNVGFQAMVDLDPKTMAARPGLYPPGELRASHYALPFEIVGPRKKVLIVGAGAGNDAAAALRAGAAQVHAVEIDPVVLEWGQNRHPNRPYADPLVRVTVDDARAFFRRDQARYDLVWFGLLDSHTNPSAYSNIRLDHFVYTRESLRDMKRLLSPDGVAVVYFAPQTGWIADRLFGLLRETFGTQPLAAAVPAASPCLGGGGLLLIAGSPSALAPIKDKARRDPGLAKKLLAEDHFPGRTRLTTDDWPYLYLESPSIPAYHLTVAAASLLLGLFFWRRAGGSNINRPMLGMGAGFMLLEVSGISRAALLFGATWQVNAYVVAGVLACALLANLIAARLRPKPLGWPASGLLLSLLALTLVPLTSLAALPAWPRAALAGLFLALPVLFSGLLFASLWTSCQRRDQALGSNLLGSLLGGLASLLSMSVGFRALSVLTLLVYGATLFFLRQNRDNSP